MAKITILFCKKLFSHMNYLQLIILLPILVTEDSSCDWKGSNKMKLSSFLTNTHGEFISYKVDEIVFIFNSF